jgi:hypothetical protein
VAATPAPGCRLLAPARGGCPCLAPLRGGGREGSTARICPAFRRGVCIIVGSRWLLSGRRGGAPGRAPPQRWRGWLCARVGSHPPRVHSASVSINITSQRATSSLPGRGARAPGPRANDAPLACDGARAQAGSTWRGAARRGAGHGCVRAQAIEDRGIQRWCVGFRRWASGGPRSTVRRVAGVPRRQRGGRPRAGRWFSRAGAGNSWASGVQGRSGRAPRAARSGAHGHEAMLLACDAAGGRASGTAGRQEKEHMGQARGGLVLH